MAMRLRAVIYVKTSNVLYAEKIYAFLTVGPNPRTSTVVRITTAQNGSEVKYRNGKDNMAETRNNQSGLVIVISARFL